MDIFLFAILGLIFGSFINLVIYRLPIMMKSSWNKEVLDYLSSQAPEAFSVLNSNSDETKNLKNKLKISKINLALPNSFCPKCKTKILWWQNIPLISFLILAGKCRNCGKKISLIYPSIEILTGALFVFLAQEFFYKNPYTFLFLAIFSLCLLVVSFIDLKSFLIPDSITLPLIWLGLFWHIVFHKQEFDQFFFGAIYGYLVLWVLNWVFKILLRKEAMGYGDFKLFAAIGAWLGWQSLLPIVFIASFLGIIAFLVGILISKISNTQNFDLKVQIPFAPFLSLATFVFIFKYDLITQVFEIWFFINDWFNFLI